MNSQRLFLKYWIIIFYILYFFVFTLNSIHSQTLGAAPLRKMSGAPIGDTSIMIYPAGGMSNSQSMIISTPALEDSFKVHNVIGLPVFMHMYRVDAVPNTTCGLPFAMSNRYFGVFVPPGVVIQYDITYYYGGNPFVTAAEEPFLDIFKRNTNSDTICPAWSPMSATFNFVADSAIKLSVTGRKEFILDHFPETPLGVQLSYFKAEWLQESQNRATIKWCTEAEINCDYFIVEKSTNLLNWIYVDQVDGNGNTDQLTFYSTVDMNAQDEYIYYRLLQYDNNGTETMYDPYMLKHNKYEESISIHPNPVGENLSINIFREQDSFIRFYLTDINGKTVFEENFRAKKGHNTFVLPVTLLSSGIYFGSILENEQMIYHKKIIVSNR